MKALGSHVKTFEDVLREIGYSPASGYNYIKIYEVYTPYIESNPNYMNINYTRLVHLLPVMHTPTGDVIPNDKAVELMESAMKLSSDNEVKKYVKQIKGIDTDACCHHKNVEVIHRCKDCRSWIKTNQ